MVQARGWVRDQDSGVRVQGIQERGRGRVQD